MTIKYTMLLWSDDLGLTYSIRIDATVAEGHVFANTVTDHPVERGAALTDHVRPNPARVTLTGMVSNHPLILPVDHVPGEISLVKEQVEINVRPRVRVLPVIPPTAAFSPAQLSNVAVTTRFSPGYSATATVVTFSDAFDRSRAVFDTLVNLRDNGTLLRVVTGLRDYTDMAIESLTVPVDASTGEALVFDLALKQVITADAQFVQIPAAKGRQAKKPITQAENDQAAGDNTVLGLLKDKLFGN